MPTACCNRSACPLPTLLGNRTFSHTHTHTHTRRAPSDPQLSPTKASTTTSALALFSALPHPPRSRRMQTPFGKEGERAMEARGLAEQLREYQIRSKHDLSSPSSSGGFSSKSDDVLNVIWELLIFAFLVLAAVSLYFRYMRVALLLICITTFLLLSMKVTKQIRKNRKSKRRLLLPLSM